MSIDQTKNTVATVPEPDPNARLRAKCFRLKDRRWILILFLSVCLLGIGFWKGDAFYYQVKMWRVGRLIAASKKAQQAGDDPAAVRSMRQAWTLLPNHGPTLRAMAEYEAWKRDPSALEIYQRLIATGRATTEDWFQFTREAFRQQRQSDVSLQGGDVDTSRRDISRLQYAPAALRGLEELSKSSSTWNRPEVIALQAERKIWDGEQTEALKLARRAAVSATGEAQISTRLVLARILVASLAAEPTERFAEQSEGMTILGEIASEPGRNGFEALEILIRLTQRSDAVRLFAKRDAEKWRQALNQHPEADERLRAAAWDLPLAAEPERKAAIVAEMCRFYGAAAPNQKLEGARRLNQHGLYRECIALLESSKVASKASFLVYLDALAGAGQWEKVAPLVGADAKVPLSPAVRRLFEDRAATELRQNPNTMTAWQDIRRLLPLEDYEDGLYVAKYAEKIGFPAEAATIYRRMLLGSTFELAATPNPRQQRLACHLGLIRAASAGMRLDELEKTLSAFSRDFPALPDVENDLTYVRLLNGSELDQAQETAARLVRLRPELLAYRTTAALAALKTGNPEAALQVYAGWQTDWATAPDRFKVVHAAVLAAAGRSEEAAAARAMIRSEGLRPEERKLAGLPDS